MRLFCVLQLEEGETKGSITLETANGERVTLTSEQGMDVGIPVGEGDVTLSLIPHTLAT